MIRRHRVWAPLIAFLPLWSLSSAWAFQAPPPLPERPAGEGLTPPSDRDAESWLARAKEAAERQDWKLAADTLMRVIDQHGDKTVSLDSGRRYYSALHCAQEQITGWPAEGIAVYRQLFDADVEQQLTQAESHFDLDALRQIARKFPMTTPGPKALNDLAGLLLDRGQAGEAIELLKQLTALPHNHVPRWQTLTKLAIAYTLSDQRASASQTLTALRESPGEPLPADWPRQVEAVQRFFEEKKGAAAATTRAAVDTWPVPLGPPAGGGRMAGIAPAVTPDEIWHDGLPGSDAVDSEVIQRLIRLTARPPVWQAVSDGKTLFVTGPDGLIARDLATFDFLWQAFPKSKPRDPRISRMRLSMNPQTSDNSDRLDEPSTRSLWHEYRGAVTTAMGLVFVLEQSGTTNEQFPNRQGAAPANEIFMGEFYAEPNSIRAFEADTGRAVWTRGRGGPLEDELKTAHFFCPPVADGPWLIAPYQVKEDFFLAVMKPDGKLVKQVLLGTGKAGMFPMNAVLQPTVHDGTIYVPTGAGLFVALSGVDFSLRWLAAYERSEPVRGRGRQMVGPWGPVVGALPQPDEWVGSPPVMAGPLVLLAPHDSNQLIAFDRQDGSVKWAFPRGDHRYIAGASGDRVVICGEQVLALDLATGKVAWVFDGERPTGRTALCGDQVLVPTAQGLIRLNAKTGEEAGPRLASERPMGNLLALDGALYSISAAGISKFPDLEQSRSIADKILARDPSDLRAILRLASLSALARDWNAALKLLDRADEQQKLLAGRAATTEPSVIGKESKSPLANRPGELPRSAMDAIVGRVAHQRVSILLALAGEAPPERRTEVLERAVLGARRPDDRVRAELALCDALADRKDAATAFRRSLSLLESVGDFPAALEPMLNARAIVPIRERLQRFWNELSEDQRRQCDAEVRKSIEAALAGGRIEPMTRLADAIGFVEEGARLDVVLARRASAKGQDESAVFYLQRALRRAPRSESGLEAGIRLAGIFSWPRDDLPRSPMDAAQVLKSLTAHHGGKPLPASLKNDPCVRGANGVDDVIARIRQVLPPALARQEPPWPQILRGLSTLELVAEDSLPSTFREPLQDCTSFQTSDQRLDLFAELLPIRLMGQLRGIRLGDRPVESVFWTSDVDSTIDSEAAASGDMREPGNQCAAVAGRIAVLEAGTQFCTVGLSSGRMMWPIMAIDHTRGPLPDPPVIRAGEMIVMASDASTLTALPAREGAQPIWQRRFAGQTLARLAAVDDLLVAIDRGATKAMVLDPLSGRIRRQFGLLTGGGRSGQAEGGREEPWAIDLVALVGKTVCRGNGKKLVGRDIATGHTLWDIDLPERITSVRALDGEHVGVCCRGGALAVIRATGGTLVRQFNIQGLTLPPIDATLDWSTTPAGLGGGRLLIIARRPDEPPEFVLASLPLDPVETTWQRDLGRYATISRAMLRASPNYLAIVLYEQRSKDIVRRQQQVFIQQNQSLGQARLIVIDKPSNTELLRTPFVFESSGWDEASGRSIVLTDVMVFDKRIVGVSPAGYYVLRRTDEKGGGAGAGRVNP